MYTEASYLAAIGGAEAGHAAAYAEAGAAQTQSHNMALAVADFWEAGAQEESEELAELATDAIGELDDARTLALADAERDWSVTLAAPTKRRAKHIRYWGCRRI